MIITRWMRYYILVFGGFIAVILYVISRIFFKVGDFDLYWPIFGLWVWLIWSFSPPYKKFEFKMESLNFNTEDQRPFCVYSFFGSIYEIFITEIDKEKGVCFGINKITGNFSDKRQKQSLGEHYLLPSSFEARMSRASGKLNILCIKGNNITSERYLEKIGPDSIGIILHIIFKDKGGYRAMIEIVKKKSSMFDMFKKKPFTI